MFSFLSAPWLHVHVTVCVCVCVVLQLWYPFYTSPPPSLLLVCEGRTIGCTGGPSTSLLPSVRFHYKQCWRWGSPLDICGLIWTGGWDTSPCRVLLRSSEDSPRDGRSGDSFLKDFCLLVLCKESVNCTINGVSFCLKPFWPRLITRKNKKKKRMS